MTQQFERHDDLAALRGVPSLVWRAGQSRRLEMILKWGRLSVEQKAARVLDNGCGVGMYLKALQPYADVLFGNEIEPEHLAVAAQTAPHAHLQYAICEQLPYANSYFDLVLSHEVLEHVQDDAAAAAEIARVLKPGGRAIIFAPNRYHPFETHGHYWRGRYHFGNTPLINYLPDPIRNRSAPHVRAYTPSGLRRLFYGQPVRIVHHAQIFPGYDNIVQRRPLLGRVLRSGTYLVEHSLFMVLGNSHLLIVEKV